MYRLSYQFRRLCLIISLLLAVSFVFADPPRGAETVRALYAPALLGGGDFVTARGGSFSDSLNPASTGLEQLVNFDAGYILLPALDGSGFGHAANLGLVLPTRYAVFGGSLHFFSSPHSSYPIGSGGGFKAGASKDLFPTLTVGAAFGADFGSSSDGAFDWRVGLDLGVQGTLGDVGFMRNLRYGAALTGIGSLGWVPRAFTPTAGIAFDLFGESAVSAFSLAVSADLGFPSFSNITGKLGFEAGLGHLVRLRAASGFNLAELIQGTAAWAIPSIGLSVNLALPGKANPDETPRTVDGKVSIDAAARPLYDSVWGFGGGAVVTLGVLDREPPSIAIDYDEPRWISPNSDGKADALTFSLSITDSRYVASWVFQLRDADGSIVRSLRNKERRLENEGVRDLYDRLVDVKSGVEVPESIRWDGAFDSGAIAADGQYSFVIIAVDDNGNRSSSDPLVVHVDNTPPSIEILSPRRGEQNIFSPDGDGNKDQFTIEQKGSAEELWTAVIYDSAGSAVRRFDFIDAAPGRVVWDGRNDSGAIVNDGVYRYEIGSIDRAKNERYASVENIIVDTERPTVSLTIDEAWISPNGDGVKDGVWFGPGAPVSDGLVSWRIDVLDKRQTVRGSLSGGALVPGRVFFDGKTNTGESLAEGSYYGSIAVAYDNGYTAYAKSPSFTVDLTAPRVNVLRPGLDALRTFSPNGDGRKDSFSVVQAGSKEDNWVAYIKDGADRTVRSYSWENAEPPEFQWDGLDDSGQPVADGRYSYEIAARDKAGNAGSADLSGIIVDKSQPTVTLSVAYGYYSPNGDGVFDDLPLLSSAQQPSSSENWTIELIDAVDQTKRSYRGLGAPPERLSFGGQDDKGNALAEASYRAKLTVDYRNGHRAVAYSPYFILDLTPPRATVAVRNAVFSPNRDGNLDSVVFTHEGSQETAWSGEIRSASSSDGKLGELVRGFRLPGVLSGDIEWDGMDDRGRLAADGLYAYRVTATDRAGNSAYSSPVYFELTTADTPVIVNTDRRSFSPNGDGLLDTILVTSQLKVLSGIESWRYEIMDISGKTVRSDSGENSIPPSYRWDGKDDKGRVVEDGSYLARIYVRYDMGNQPSASSALFTIDTIPPSINLAINDRVFSPNVDGVKDILPIDRKTERPEDEWTAWIANVVGTKLRTWTWKGASSSFTWDGKDNAGNRVPDGEYSLQAESRDPAGNYMGRVIEGIIVDTEAPYLEASIADPVFSPNADSVKDTLRVDQTGGGEDEWYGTIVNAAGATLRTWRWKGKAAAIEWDGKDDAGKLVPDGAYRYRASSMDKAGNSAQYTLSGIVIDTVAPRIYLGADNTLFSPNGDGRKDTLSFLVRTDGDDEWKAALVDEKGQAVMNYKWKGAAPSFVWDGKDTAGNVVSDGSYSFIATATDAAGNSARGELSGFIVDNRIPRVYLTVSSQAISPNGDGRDDELALGSFVGLKDGIEGWKLEILDEAGALSRVYQSGLSGEYSATVVPTSFIWDGRDAKGAIKEGLYHAKLTVSYIKGDIASAQSGAFLIDISPPLLSFSTVPPYFSPDNDGVDDEVVLNLSADDAVDIAAWSLEVYEPQPPYQLFYKVEGQGAPAPAIVWDGRSNNGELVQAATDYDISFSAVDILGNASVMESSIGVDVFVIREGDVLRIKVPSIIFRENASDFDGVDLEVSENNIRVLRRIAEILNKFSAYRITVEGHANPVTRTPEEEKQELQPLSESRAKAVVALLVEYGVDPSRLSAVGMGGTKPLVKWEDRDDWWKNRRVEFILNK